MKRPGKLLAAAVAIGVSSLVLVACGSSSPGGSGGAAAAAAPKSLCQQIGGVLADGPDAGADPVGSALSHIKLLQDIHGSDAPVMRSIAKLVAADQDLVTSNGSDTAAASAIEKADAALNKACPGVAS